MANQAEIVRSNSGGSTGFAGALVKIAVILTLGALTGIYLVLIVAPEKALKSITHTAVKSTFDSYITGLQAQNHLQVAQLKTSDQYFLTSEKRLLRYLPGGTVEVAAEVSCEITYRVPLKDAEWRFFVADNGRRLHVIAPEIGFNTPAVDLSRYKLEVVKYSYIRDNEEVKQLLQAQIPEKLDEVARQNVNSVRDAARLSVKEFIDNWLLAAFSGDSRYLPVVDRVFFADEPHLYQNFVFVSDAAEKHSGLKGQ